VAKSRTRPRSKKQPAQPAASSFALSPGWLAAETFLVPGATLLLVFVVLAKYADAGSASLQIGVVGAFVAIRLPLLVWTLARDPRIVIGTDALRVPIVGVFQFRAWTIPFDELASVSASRKSGGSSRIVLGLRGGRTRTFAASVVRDREQLIKALERRIDAVAR
jgi:hypothetical protein